MKTIKLQEWNEIPQGYTGIVEWENGDIDWFKNGGFHREDGPARIYKEGFKVWYLDGKFICNSNDKLDLANQIVLSKHQHPKYPTVQVWKILNKNKVYERIVIPGMEEFIKE